MIRYAAAYVGSALVMAVLDALWLTLANRAVYRPALDRVLMTDGFRLGPAIVFYVIYLVGVTVFATAPALRQGQWTAAALMGGLFGFFCYATYDLTNQATLLVWSTRVTLIDMAWGTFITACAATAGYFAGRLAPNGS